MAIGSFELTPGELPRHWHILRTDRMCDWEEVRVCEGRGEKGYPIRNAETADPGPLRGDWTRGWPKGPSYAAWEAELPAGRGPYLKPAQQAGRRDARGEVPVAGSILPVPAYTAERTAAGRGPQSEDPRSLWRRSPVLRHAGSSLMQCGMQTSMFVSDAAAYW
jgi:hypothetical protein